MIRDIMLGKLPPNMFCDSIYALTSLLTSIIMIAMVYNHIRKHKRKLKPHEHRMLNKMLLWADTVGLGIFTVVGESA